MLIVSKKAGGSGLAYDASQDLGKVKMQMSKPPSLVENLKYTIEIKGGKGKSRWPGRTTPRPCPFRQNNMWHSRFPRSHDMADEAGAPGACRSFTGLQFPIE